MILNLVWEEEWRVLQQNKGRGMVWSVLLEQEGSLEFCGARRFARLRACIAAMVESIHETTREIEEHLERLGEPIHGGIPDVVSHDLWVHVRYVMGRRKAETGIVLNLEVRWYDGEPVDLRPCDDPELLLCSRIDRGRPTAPGGWAELGCRAMEIMEEGR